MSKVVHMVIGDALALPGNKFRVGEKRFFIFLYLTNSHEAASEEALSSWWQTTGKKLSAEKHRFWTSKG
jgi:hypothetical protein